MSRRRPRLPDDFRWRIALVATAIAVTTSVLVSAVSVVRAARISEQDLTTAGRQLVHWVQGEVVLGVLAENTSDVDAQAHRFLALRDVAGVVIYRGSAPFSVTGRLPPSLGLAGEGQLPERDAVLFRAPIVLEPTAGNSGIGDTEPKALGTALLVLSRSRLRRDVMHTIALNLLVLVGAVALALVASAVTARKVAGPVQTLIDAAERIRAGQHGVQVPVESTDAIGRLSATFNRMAEDLRRSSEQLEATVAERTQALTEVNKELEAFSYSVSHDLRAPLRHIIGFVELLKDSASAALDDDGRRYLEVITESAARMGSLIDDLLALSRIGRATMTEETVRLRQIFEEVRQELAREAQGRAIEWQFGPMPAVRGDTLLLRSAVTNLLSNAIKYTRSRTPARIEAGCEVRERDIVCFVRDNGVGFDMRFVDKLFGAFQRLHRAGEFEGTGVGLATVRRIIQRHGGRVWAEGEVGKGAVFYLSLPRTREVT